jgi:hypothetical protein
MIGIFGLLVIAMILVVKFCKKTLKIVLSIIIILATIYSVIIFIDINRVESFREPIFAIVKQENDLTMKTIMYQGLGYEIKLVKDVTNNKIIQMEMYMFNKCIAGAIE